MADQPGSLAAALVQLQANLPHVTKDAENPHFHSRYASLGALSDALLPVMAGLGLSWICIPTLNWQIEDNPVFVLSYELKHTSGESLLGFYPLPTSGTPQQIGSAITYARRYALSAVTGLVADDDDDGNAASSEPASAALSAEEREAAGMMTTGQRREHGKIAAMDKPPRAADRANDPADDMWAGRPAGQWSEVTPEDKPGSLNSKQLQAIQGRFRQLGLTTPKQRHEKLTGKLGRTVSDTGQLSYTEAQRVIRELKEEIDAIQRQEAPS